jgi:hypothetical protein
VPRRIFIFLSLLPDSLLGPLPIAISAIAYRLPIWNQRGGIKAKRTSRVLTRDSLSSEFRKRAKYRSLTADSYAFGVCLFTIQGRRWPVLS